MRLPGLFGWLAPSGNGTRHEIIGSRVLSNGATLVVAGGVHPRLAGLSSDRRPEVDRHLDYIRHNPALNDGPASHHKCPVVHKYAGDFLYCYIYGVSEMILRKFRPLMGQSECRELERAQFFSVLLLRLITLPDGGEVRDRMADFPADTREAVRLRFAENQTIEQISEQLQTTPLTVRRMLVRGLDAVFGQAPTPSNGSILANSSLLNHTEPSTRLPNHDDSGEYLNPALVPLECWRLE